MTTADMWVKVKLTPLGVVCTDRNGDPFLRSIDMNPKAAIKRLRELLDNIEKEQSNVQS